MNVSGKTEAFETFEILRNFVVMENFGRIWGGSPSVQDWSPLRTFPFLVSSCFSRLLRVSHGQSESTKKR